MNDRCQKVASRWDDAHLSSAIEAKVWTASPTVRRYLHRLASGHPDCDWPTYVRANHMPASVDRVLVLGCGSGWLDRALWMKGGIRSVVACDCAPAAVERARELARAGDMNIEYSVLDLERDELPGTEFDVIVANDVLHHVTNLETLYARIQGALRPDGRFIFAEYVGPNRFQYSDAQMDIINTYMRVIPDRLRYDPCLKITLWKKERLSIDRVVADDPTEAVRSEDVLPLARSMFKVESEYPYGGSLLSPLLYEIIVNFDESNPEDRRLLEILCGAEDRLIRAGQLSADFCIFVGGLRG
jgi:2-polyprenyl-3-methyl-5-hydroxy-6-metoxy-1,4-benzoquinol methylase